MIIVVDNYTDNVIRIGDRNGRLTITTNNLLLWSLLDLRNTARFSSAIGSRLPAESFVAWPALPPHRSPELLSAKNGRVSLLKQKCSVRTLLFYTYYAFFHDYFLFCFMFTVLFKCNPTTTPIETGRYIVLVIFIILRAKTVVFPILFTYCTLFLLIFSLNKQEFLFIHNFVIINNI